MTRQRGTRSHLANPITKPSLQAAAGDRFYERGVAYFESGAVTDLVVSGGRIRARVVGTDDYDAELWITGRRLGYSCTCPLGADGTFCKHNVAAGLAWLAREQQTRSAGHVEDDLLPIRRWLAAARRAQLEELLIEQALGDPGLRSRIEAQAARSQARSGVDLDALKEAAARALAVSGFVDYRGMRRFLERARSAVDLVAGLVEDDHPDAARELAHHALKRGISAYTRIDDSEGGFGDLLRDVAALHLKTCRASPPDPAAFGKQLFELLMLDEWGLVPFDDYKRFLGSEGLRVVRALAEKKWQTVPVRGPGQSRTVWDTPRFQITAIMEALARETADTDALVAVRSRDLTCPYRFLEIATTLAEAGRHDEALDWAERGHRTFPDQPDSRLVDFLAREYARRGRHEAALTLTWEQFTHQPRLDSYQQLHKVGTGAGVWDGWRSKALIWLREAHEAAHQRKSRRLAWQGGHSLLVEIFLWEGDVDAALTEARGGGCTLRLWLAIAQAREKDHPADAADIYRARLDDIVGQKSNRGYDEAVALVKKICALMQQANDEQNFTAWLDTVRMKHKAKRNFMERLDKAMGRLEMARYREVTA